MGIFVISHYAIFIFFRLSLIVFIVGAIFVSCNKESNFEIEQPSLEHRQNSNIISEKTQDLID